MKYPKLMGALVVLVLTTCAASPSGGGSLSVPEGAASGSTPGKRVLGIVESYSDPVRIEVPSSVRQGQPFVVTVVTYGGGCIGEGETKVEVEALRAELRPYDYDISPTLPANVGCTLELILYEHTATLRFEKAGTAEVVFFGRKRNADGFTQTSVARTVEVR